MCMIIRMWSSCIEAQGMLIPGTSKAISFPHPSLNCSNLSVVDIANNRAL